MASYFGTSGNDYYNYNGSESFQGYGFGGNDSIYGNTNNDYIAGSSGDDYLIGYTGDDQLYGDSGSDTLYGGGGSDTLYGSYSTAYDGYEYDVLNGGDGYDRFVLGTSGTSYSGNYYQGNGYATIQDYNPANDYIQLNGSASSFYLGTANYEGTSDLDTLIYQNDGDLLAVVQDKTGIQLTNYYFSFV
ncbi:calcium-binding protein [Nostoc sp.]|uniref:calcium-binding protein n=1 Tax=Nostoc sp. TaxID=1180 RepID=UPI002FF91E54